MTTLRVVMDALVASPSDALARYTTELTRALIATAPQDCDVEGITSSTTNEVEARLTSALPGISAVHSATLGSRELAIAWQLGVVGSSGSGLVHAPSLMAPLTRHRRDNGDQISVTVHDVFAWTRPESIGATSVAGTKALLRRARKHADAVVVPSHAVAEQLAEISDLGDRIRVIPGAGRPMLSVPSDGDARARSLGLPSSYIVASGSLDPREGLESLATGLARSGLGVPLVVLDAGGPEARQDAPEALHSPDVLFLGDIDDADRAIVLSRSQLFVLPTIDDGFGAPLLDALRLGIPVVHSDAPALIELAGDAGVSVDRSDPEIYPDRLASAIESLLADDERRSLLGLTGSDRARLFTWRDTGERLWQLHADL
ncbi:glycosyltransferase family 1 protein [Leifsonia sp. YIM 134122]|uniref:Glycosyltransferase family 1 protein n=1 Tax=Leifsonia stereocauli TaxID=3134136 RepID=A0ABU9W3J8_9MICO